MTGSSIHNSKSQEEIPSASHNMSTTWTDDVGTDLNSLPSKIKIQYIHTDDIINLCQNIVKTHQIGFLTDHVKNTWLTIPFVPTCSVLPKCQEEITHSVTWLTGRSVTPIDTVPCWTGACTLIVKREHNGNYEIVIRVFTRELYRTYPRYICALNKNGHESRKISNESM